MFDGVGGERGNKTKGESEARFGRGDAENEKVWDILYKGGREWRAASV